MGRRNSRLLDDLAQLPWWLSIVLGIGGYAAVVFGAPLLADGNPLLEAMTEGGAADYLASFWLIICLVGAAISAFKAWRTRRLYDSQRGSPNLASLTWQEFERLVGEHFRQRGYDVHETGGPRPDGGIDLIVSQGRERYVVQCKHWKARQIDVSVVRELVGSITQSGATGGFLVTSGTITRPAQKLARDAGIEVVDGPTLRADLTSRSSSPMGNVAQTPAPEAPSATPSCPFCRDPMVIRTARRGRQAGQKFWGCSRFPSCRGTRAFQA